MTSPAGFLDFFVFEASELIEQLDGLVAGGHGGRPDLDALQRASRALRGSATMAKLPNFAALAAAVERVARGVREGAVAWEPAVAGAMIAAVDDLKILLRGARAWSDAEDARARGRVDELSRYAPDRPMTPIRGATGAGGFFAGEAANIAAGLELLLARPNDREGAENVLRRVRALRGVAGIRELPPLPDVAEAAEAALRPMELGAQQLGPAETDVLRAAGDLLREIAVALRDGRTPDAASAARQRFTGAVDQLLDTEASRDRIVPIAELFFADAGPHLVSESPNPPTTPAERFRLELVSQSEHLRALVADARSAHDDAARSRMSRELRKHLRALRAVIESFGEEDAAAFVTAHLDAAGTLDFLGLAALEDMAAALADPGANNERLRKQAASMRASRAVDAGIAAGFGGDAGQLDPLHTGEMAISTALGAPAPAPMAAPVAAPAPAPMPVAAPAPVPAPAPVATPVAPPMPAAMPEPMRPAAAAAAPSPGSPASMLTPMTAAAAVVSEVVDAGAAGLSNLLERGIAGLEAITSKPLVEPIALPEQPPVPIENLLYRGPAAIRRAIEIRNEIRSAGGPPSPEKLAELYDLLDLALAS